MNLIARKQEFFKFIKSSDKVTQVNRVNINSQRVIYSLHYKKTYLKALKYGEFAMKFPKKRSSETLHNIPSKSHQPKHQSSSTNRIIFQFLKIRYPRVFGWLPCAVTLIACSRSDQGGKQVDRDGKGKSGEKGAAIGIREIVFAWFLRVDTNALCGKCRRNEIRNSYWLSAPGNDSFPRSYPRARDKSRWRPITAKLVLTFPLPEDRSFFGDREPVKDSGFRTRSYCTTRNDLVANNAPHSISTS